MLAQVSQSHQLLHKSAKVSCEARQQGEQRFALNTRKSALCSPHHTTNAVHAISWMYHCSIRKPHLLRSSSVRKSTIVELTIVELTLTLPCPFGQLLIISFRRDMTVHGRS